MNSYYHSKSSSKKWGGDPRHYKDIHDFLDSTKAHVADMKHRSILHNSWGIFMVEKMFGDTIDVPGEYTTRQIPSRLIAERHVMEDLGKIPSLDDYLKNMTTQPWMAGAHTGAGAKANKVLALPTIEAVMERMGLDGDS